MVTFLAQEPLVNTKNFMRTVNEFKWISLAYHVMVTIYFNTLSEL